MKANRQSSKAYQDGRCAQGEEERCKRGCRQGKEGAKVEACRPAHDYCIDV